MLHVRRYHDYSGVLQHARAVGYCSLFCVVFDLLPFTGVIVFIQSTCLLLVLSFVRLRLPIEVIVDVVISHVVFFPFLVLSMSFIPVIIVLMYTHLL